MFTFVNNKINETIIVYSSNIPNVNDIVSFDVEGFNREQYKVTEVNRHYKNIIGNDVIVTVLGIPLYYEE